MTKLYAFLIGIDCYLDNLLPDGSYYPPLRGSVRDINYVEKFLLRQPQTPTQIIKLTASNPDAPKPDEPPELWPTYENMVAQFQHLTSITEPGDLVFLYYSGHGGRAKTNYPQLKGKNGVDEVIVPVDIGNDEGQYLRDIEIAHLLQAMVDKGLVVTFVADCCNSGGMTRGKDVAIRGLETIDTTPRQKPSLVALESELAQTWHNLTSTAKRKATMVGSLLPEAKGYVLLAACRPSEFAYEYAFDGKKRNGALTYWLLDTLNQPSPQMTYKQVYDRLYAKIHSQFPTQTPVLMGEGDRLIFGKECSIVEYGVTVMQVEQDGYQQRIQIDGGQAQGLRKGAQLAIYPRISLRDEKQQPVIAEITELGATQSWAEVIKIRGVDFVIESGAQAVVTAASVNLVKKVRLLGKETIWKSLEVAIANNGWSELVGEEEAADFQVVVNGNNYEICDRTGKAFLLRPSININEKDAVETISKRLVHLTKYQATQELDNHDFRSPLRGKIVVELLGKQRDYDPVDLPNPQPFANPERPEIEVGEYLLMKVRNDFSDVLNICVLDLQSDWAIDQVHPYQPGSNFIPLDPGQEELIILQMSLPEREQIGKDIIKVFATLGNANFRWLELPPLDKPIPPPEEKGFPRTGDPLEQLLMSLAAEQPPTRKANPLAFPSKEWITLQVEIDVVSSMKEK